MPDIVTAIIVITALEGALGAVAPDFHAIHAPLPEAPAHCHAGDGCADPHEHLGTHKK